jgi:hypothetical protein
MNVTNIFEENFNWWLSATARYLQVIRDRPFFFKGMEKTLELYLDAKARSDRMLDEMWRNLRFPPLEEIVRVHERLNYLESLLLEQKGIAKEDHSALRKRESESTPRNG